MPGLNHVCTCCRGKNAHMVTSVHWQGMLWSTGCIQTSEYPLGSGYGLTSKWAVPLAQCRLPAVAQSHSVTEWQFLRHRYDQMVCILPFLCVQEPFGYKGCYMGAHNLWVLTGPSTHCCVCLLHVACRYRTIMVSPSCCSPRWHTPVLGNWVLTLMSKSCSTCSIHLRQLTSAGNACLYA